MESLKVENKTANCNGTSKPYNQTPTTHEQPMHIPSVTQIMPESGALSGKKIEPATDGDSPTQQQLEQDVAATNPSVESMESRG